MAQDVRPVEALLSELRSRGFAVIESSPTSVTLERTNSWAATLAGAAIGTLSGGINPSPRRERVYVHIFEGVGAVRLYPPRDV